MKEALFGVLVGGIGVFESLKNIELSHAPWFLAGSVVMVFAALLGVCTIRPSVKDVEEEKGGNGGMYR